MGFERHVTRRALLRLGGTAIIGTTVAGVYAAPAVASDLPFARTFAWERRDIPLADGPVTSPPLACAFPFNALQARWDADLPAGVALDLSVRARAEGAAWGDWIRLHADDHARDADDGEGFGGLTMVAPAAQAQYRVAATAGEGDELPTLRAFTLTAVDTIGDGLAPVEAFALSGATPKILSRGGWGADERLRFDTKNAEIWPPEYRRIEKVVIHHTVTGDPDPRPAATIRAIYQYHAVARGWGDIGYNYLIDPGGAIYEGRHGGPGVVGGHTAGYNAGSMGVAMLGTYDTHTVSAAARHALGALIRAKAGDLDPLGRGPFRDREGIWNIGGHRALTQTECPGDSFYPTLNNLRREMKGLPPWAGDPHDDPLAANPADASVPLPTRDKPTPRVVPAASAVTVRAALMAVAWPADGGVGGDLFRVRVTVKNTGTAALRAVTPAPTLIYAEGESYASKGIAILPGTFNIGIGPATRPNAPPYRWGLARDLGPGESATVTVAIRVRAARQLSLVVTLRREGYAILDQSEPGVISVS